MSAPQEPKPAAAMPPPSCPVSYAPAQPLPPGHPPVDPALNGGSSASTLKPPTDPRCVFFRTTDDLNPTPPLSRAGSTVEGDLIAAAAAKSATLAASNIRPLEEGSGSKLDPDTTLVLASRNSQLALIQSSHVSRMLQSQFGKDSPAFLDGPAALAADKDHTTPPASPPAHTSDADGNVTYLNGFHFTSAQVDAFKQKSHSLGLKAPSVFPITSMSTSGDQNLRSPLYVIGGEGRAIWTKELEVALAAGGVDAIVHSLKDVPTTLPDGLRLAAVLEREDPRDALVIKAGLPYKTLNELPPGSVIGTSSVRRVAQLRRRYPELVFSDVRGNLNTRLAKLDSPTGPYTALVLAAAGLIRLSMANRITAFLSAPVLLHSVGQGSLGIEVREPPKGADPRTNRDARILKMIEAIGDWRATWRAEAERSLLRELEGGCSIPVGVETRFEDHDEVEGRRNEGVEALKYAAREKGGEGQVVEVEGHSIPIAAMEEDVPPPAVCARPSKLRRLDTEHQGNEEQKEIGAPAPEATNGHANGDSSAAAATATDIASQLPPPPGPQRTTTGTLTSAPDADSIAPLYPEDRATFVPTQKGSDFATLHLKACVVSLDGTRECSLTRSKECRSVEDARELGIEVAHELANKRGARVILDEVERHRKLAEEADERRRRAGREARVRDVMGAAPSGAGNGSGSGNGKEGGDEEEEEARRKLEEALKAHQNSPEIDRRGLPRDDGQPKAWEV